MSFMLSDIDLSGITDDTVLSGLTDALKDPSASARIQNLLDRVPGLKSYKITNEFGNGVFVKNEMTWETAYNERTGVMITNINPDYLNVMSKNTIANNASTLSHEIAHSADFVNAFAGAALDSFTASPGWSDWASRYGKALAANAAKYAFEEFRIKVLENEFRISAGLSPIKIGLNGEFSYTTFATMLADVTGSLSAFQAVMRFYGDFFVRRQKSAIAAIEADLSDDGVTLRSDGAVDLWVGPGGVIGQTRLGSHYTKQFLDHYGVIGESGVAGAGFGAHFRALADLIGFDGDFGIQGTWAKSGEGNAFGRPLSVIDGLGSAPPVSEGTIVGPISGGLNRNSIKTGGQLQVDKDHDGYDDRTGKDDWGNTKSDAVNNGGLYPILLDLDGNGVKIDEISRSTTFIDAGGDGLKHRTAWAGAGDGVLFFDADGDGTLSERREYVFTEWDPTASSDMEALRSYFDTNGDGKLTAADAGFAQFRVLVTNADGTKTARTLAELGITEINLTEDATRILLPDGSVIEGQTTFTKSDGSTGTVASTALVAAAEGYRVDFWMVQAEARAAMGWM